MSGSVRLKTKELSNLFKYISSLLNDSEHLEQDLHLLKGYIKSLKDIATELETYAGQVQSYAEENRAKITKLVQYFMKKIEDGQTMVETQTSVSEPPRTEADTAEKTRKSPTAPSPGIQQEDHGEGVIIYITPESDDGGQHSADSTHLPRRQLLPTSQEEKMILDYLIGASLKPTQKEYNRLYKEITNMLVNSPKNAIAIQVRRAGSTGPEGQKYIELFFHVRIKDNLDFAGFKYVEMKGVDAYRKKEVKHE